MSRPIFTRVTPGQGARAGIDPIVLLTGALPPRAFALVLEWATLHHGELLDNWLPYNNSRIPLLP
jgi:hypothetical protein